MRLASLDGCDRTFYISGFSKVLSLALRLGYVVAPAAFVERLVEQAHHAGILLASGALFSSTGEYDPYIRFNVSHCNHPGFKRFLQAHKGLAVSRRAIGHDA